MTEFALDGLDAANPLGMLAALGALRISTLIWPQPRLYWQQTGDGWRARLTLEDQISAAGWLEALESRLREPEPALGIADDLTVPCQDFRRTLLMSQRAARPDARQSVDFLAALGSEAVQARVSGKPNGLIADTALRTMSGAGHQHFLGFMRALMQATTAAHLEAALFHPWTYADDGPSLRWDPADDRRYALRWKEPSGDPIRTVRGANRLAIEALPLLPTAPTGTELETTGFRRRRGEGVAWTWPVWTLPVGLDTARSLLSLAALQGDKLDRRTLGVMGIAEVYRSVRLTLGKYRNFGMAAPVAQVSLPGMVKRS